MYKMNPTLIMDRSLSQLSQKLSKIINLEAVFIKINHL
jgi:hypothetical protein